MVKSIRIENEYLGTQKDGEWSHEAYKTTIRYGSKQMTVPFKMGLGLSREPEAGDVMSALLMDLSVKDCASFEDFASEYGYEIDSRKAESIYKQCLKQSDKFERLVGDDLPLIAKKYGDY